MAKAAAKNKRAAEVKDLSPTWWVQLLLVVYLFLIGLLALTIMLDVWSGQFTIIDRIPGLDITALTWDHRLDMKTFPYTVGGGVLGAVLINIKEVLSPSRAIKRLPLNKTISVFVTGPWVAILLGAAIYMLVRGGVLVYGGGLAGNQVSETGDPQPLTSFGYLAIGVVTGAGWKRMLSVVGNLSGRFAIED